MSKKSIYSGQASIDESFAAQVKRLRQMFDHVPATELNEFDRFAMEQMTNEAKKSEAEKFRKELKRIAELAGIDIHYQRQKYYKQKDALARIEQKRKN